ncbi:MAG: hypothetical protein J4F28_07440 [Nitrosopumilaceae archaeon]|nr:hypothetical protein [Nitrosopumilaceae archaeon]
MKLAIEEFERTGEADPLALYNQGIKAEKTREKYTRMLRLVLCDLLEDILKGIVSIKSFGTCWIFALCNS